MIFESRIEGGEELEKFLSAFPVKTERKYLAAGLRGPTKIIKSRVRREIKLRFKSRTGVLLRSVKHKTVKSRYGAGIIISLSSIEGETRSIRNKSKRTQKIKSLKQKKASGKFKDAYYARFLILGTKTKSGKRRIKENNFLDDALNSEAKQSKYIFSSSIISAFEKDAAKMLLK